MPTLEIARFEDSLVIHFGCDRPQVNAYTLASALVGIADAAKAANAAINPGYEIEVVVEALGRGSFKTTVRAIYRGLGNLFSREAAKAVVLNVLAAVLYQYTLAPDVEVVVNVTPTEAIIEQGDTRIVVPRAVYDAAPQAERSPNFRKGLADAIRAVEADPDIHSIGLSPDPSDPAPVLPILRDRFALITHRPDLPEPDTRELVEVTDLQIVRAILERSKRKWQFVWNGIRISAPVTDDRFYDDFFAHEITIAPGDVLRARLRVRQRRHPDLNIFINEEYEVLEVVQHVPQPRERSLPGVAR